MEGRIGWGMGVCKDVLLEGWSSGEVTGQGSLGSGNDASECLKEEKLQQGREEATVLGVPCS